MRRWLKLAIWIYPAAWQKRYGGEFDALLTDINPRPSDLWDILRGAITMQLATPSTYLKLGAITAVIGALVAGGASFALPARYVSTAIMRISPQLPSGVDAEQAQMIATERLQQLQQQVLSRVSLARMIQQPELDLYHGDRQRYPLEDIIQNMRTHDVRIQWLEPKAPIQGTSSTVSISFEYPDRKVAQGVVRALVARLNEANLRTTDRAPAAPVNLEVLDPASLPEKASSPDRFAIAAMGLAGGFVLGLILAYLRRQPLRWTLWVAGSAIIGFAAFFGLAFPANFDPGVFATLGAAAAASIAAYLLRDHAAWRPAPYLKSAFAAAVCTGIVAGLASFALPNHYISSAVLRATPARIDASGLPAINARGGISEHLRRMEMEILSRSSLSEIIQRPSLDLYRTERQRRPLEDIIQDMRSRSIRIQPVNASRVAFQISFDYANRYKAQAVVRELITKFIETNVSEQRSANRAPGEPGGFVMEVLDPASFPENPSSPNRAQIAVAGFAAGIPIGLLIAFIRRRPPGQASSALRLAGATGIVGAVVAGAISFAIPNRYVSTATLRMLPSESAGEPDRGSGQVHQRMIEVLSRSSLSELIQQPELNLYHSERTRQTMEEVVARMRNRALRIESLDVDGSTGTTTAFTIAFEYPDAIKAHDVVQKLVSAFVEGDVSRSYLEVLDPPSMPNVPSFPARLPIAGAGMLAGVFVGPVFLLRRRQTL